MKCKVAAVAGAITGWGGAVALIFTGEGTQAVLAQAALLSAGITSTGWLMACARSRPLQHAFELGCDAGWRKGYEAGRCDERVAEAGGGRVIRLVPGERRVSV